MAYKCGNLTDSPSRFGFFRRRRLEKQVNYNNTKHPIFLYAYRAFIDALAQQDKATLKKMCEGTLYQRLMANSEALSKYHSEYYLVAKDIQLKMKLLDTRIITGPVYIERSKNLQKEYYDVTENSADKVTYKKKQKTILGKELGIDFEQLLKERRPQGLNTGFKSDATEEDDEVSIIQLDLQFTGNLRLGIRHKDEPSLTIGAPADFHKDYEHHTLRFERYFKLPLDLRVLRDKLQKEALGDAKKLASLRDEETLNPWQVTDLDFCLDGNPFSK